MPELTCQRCHAVHPPWSVTNEIWNEVVDDDEHFLCPTCFIVVAQERGVSGIWRLTVDRVGSLYSQMAREPSEVSI